jgi:hypothetical protein
MTARRRPSEVAWTVAVNLIARLLLYRETHRRDQ